MTEASNANDTGLSELDLLAEAFLADLRSGHAPDVERVAAAHAHLADRIRQTFPALAEVEQVSRAVARPPARERPVVLGDYRIVREIGRGGMGVVYEAVHEPLDRRVALKVLSEVRAREARAERFRREARVAAGLHHTNIVPVFDVGERDGVSYYAMQLIDGLPLSGVLAELRRGGAETRPANVSTAGSTSLIGATREQFFRNVAGVVAAAADAVAHAHAHGVLHRDLKPANLLLDSSGTVWVTDFGLAKAAGDDDLTETGDVLGTLRYLPPERLKGEGDARADVYALGATLYELLTLRPAYPEPDRARLVELLTATDPPAPRAVRPDVPPDLETVTRKAMARSPADRYQTARELSDDLQRCLAGEPILARPPHRFERVYRWAKRHPSAATAYLLAGCLTVVAVGGASAGWQWQRAERALGRLTDAQGLTALALEREQRERGKAETAIAAERAAHEREAKLQERLARSEYGRTMQVAYQEWRENNIPTALALLNATRPDLRGWEWHYVHRLCHADQLTLRGHNNALGGAVFSPNGTRVLTVSQDGTAMVWEVPSAKPEGVAKRPGPPLLALPKTEYLAKPAFDADGARIVTGGEDKSAKVWDAVTGKELHTLTGHAKYLVCVAFSPDGTRVVTVAADGVLKTWNAGTGAELSSVALRASGNDVDTAALSPDGTRVVGGCVDNLAKVWDVKTGNDLLTLKGHTRSVSSAVFSADGKRIATAGGADKTVRIWNAETGDSVTTFWTHTRYVASVAFNPSGTRVVTASIDSTAKVWDAKSGAELFALKGHLAKLESAVFSPDGTRIVTASIDSTAKVWDATAGYEVRTFRGHTDYVLSAEFSGDGTRIITGSADHTARVWNPKTGTGLVLKGHRRDVFSAALNDDGSEAVTGSLDTTAKLWSVTTGDDLFTFQKPLAVRNPGPIEDVVVVVPPRTMDEVFSVALSPDGTRVATGDGNGIVRVWNHTSREVLSTIKTHAGAVKVSFSRDGTKLLAGCEWGAVWVWDVATGKELLSLRVHVQYAEAMAKVSCRILESAALSADSTRIVTASCDGTAKVWDAVTGKELLTLKGHTGAVNSASFSPDGTRIVTGSFDNTVKVWDAETGAEYLTLKGHTDFVTAVSFSPDGMQILTGSYDKTARMWDATRLPWTPAPKATALAPQQPIAPVVTFSP